MKSVFEYNNIDNCARCITLKDNTSSGLNIDNGSDDLFIPLNISTCLYQ